MRRLATAWFALAFILAPLFMADDARAQQVPHLFMFESLEEDTTFFFTYGDTPDDPNDRDYFIFSNWQGTPHQGVGSLMIDWSVFTDQSWGGSSGLIHQLPDTLDEPVYLDLSDFTHVRLWYNTLVPTETASTFRLKLHDASLGIGTGPSSETEDWYSESTSVFTAQPGWREFVMPLDDLGLPGQSVAAGGFSRPGCQSGGDPMQQSGCWSGLLGNEKLDLDKIGSFTLEFTGPQAGATYDSLIAGTIVFDNLHATGVRYNLVEGFDDASALSHWKNSTAGSYTVVNVADTVQGTGAIEVDYNLVGDQGWGGSIDIERAAQNGHFEDMPARTHLSLFYKVLAPASDNNNVQLTIKLFEDSHGQVEEWHYTTKEVLGDDSGQWRRLLIPLRMASGDQPGFAIPSWMGSLGNDSLDVNSITKWQVQIYGNEGTTTTGTILFDRFTGYGFQETDNEPPAAVQSLDVTTTDFANLVSWEDVDGEEGERYDLYFSTAPITDVEAEGVMVAATNISELSEVYLHPIYAPVSDQEMTFHYAITVTDRAGNTSEVASTGAVTNMAKGLATISMVAPGGFVADGDLSEWSGITPIHVEPNGDLGHVPVNFVVSDATDLSGDVYLAMDAEALYVAYDITDNAHHPVPDGVTSSRWLYDGTELYIGLYDWRGAAHDSYNRGDEPDYKFYFYTEEALLDGRSEPLFTADGQNYSFTQTDNGYVIEARLPFADFVYDGAPAFVPQDGMRVPLDFVIMDNDLGGAAREGLMTYSFDNDDNSWQSPSNWFYTWIGSSFTVDVEDAPEGGLPERYLLHANYPNPFNPSTLIRYELPAASDVTLRVFNVLGQEVMTLIDGAMPAGTHEVRFDATGLPSGLYFYQIRSGSFVQARTMMLVR